MNLKAIISRKGLKLSFSWRKKGRNGVQMSSSEQTLIHCEIFIAVRSTHEADELSPPSDPHSQISEVFTASWASGEPSSGVYFTFPLACRDISRASLYIIGCRVCQQTVNDNFQMEISVKGERAVDGTTVPTDSCVAGFQRLHIKARPFPPPSHRNNFKTHKTLSASVSPVSESIMWNISSENRNAPPAPENDLNSKQLMKSLWLKSDLKSFHA